METSLRKPEGAILQKETTTIASVLSMAIFPGLTLELGLRACRRAARRPRADRPGSVGASGGPHRTQGSDAGGLSELRRTGFAVGLIVIKETTETP